MLQWNPPFCPKLPPHGTEKIPTPAACLSIIIFESIVHTLTVLFILHKYNIGENTGELLS